MTQLKFITIALVLTGAATLYGSPNGTSIAINFGADEPDGAMLAFVDGAAGVLQTENWNNFESYFGGPEPLEMDVNGAATPSAAEVAWDTTNTWSSAGRGEENNDAPEGNDYYLMLGYLDQDDVEYVSTVEVTNLDPVFLNNGYDVYVYFQGGVNGRGGEYTIGDETVELVTNEPFDGTFIEWDEQDQLGNYYVFRGITEPNLLLEAEPTQPAGGTERAPINAIEIVAVGGGGAVLQAGDANMDLEFNQLDLVQVQIAAKYLSGQDATWGEGDWNGAPGGSPGDPPAGDGRFDQLDIIAALNANVYLTGPYAALAGEGGLGDDQTSITYNPATGELGVDAPVGRELTSINIDSASGIFTGDPAANLGGSFDNDTDDNIFKATFGGSFGSLSFGNVAQTGLSKDAVMADLTAVGSLAGGGDLGPVDLVYVPEPTGILLAAWAAGLLMACVRRRR